MVGYVYYCYSRPIISESISLVGLSLDEEVPDYDLDSEDEEWLSLQTNEKVRGDCVPPTIMTCAQSIPFHQFHSKVVSSWITSIPTVIQNLPSSYEILCFQ